MITKELEELVETCKGLGFTKEEMKLLVTNREKFDKLYEKRINLYLEEKEK